MLGSSVNRGSYAHRPPRARSGYEGRQGVGVVDGMEHWPLDIGLESWSARTSRTWEQG